MEEKDSIRDLMLIQPNNVTFGQFSVTPIQDNILTLINEQLQQFMTNKTPVSCDLFGEPYVTIKCDEAGGKNHKALVIKEARDLMKKVFTFRWVHPTIHRTMETSGVIITTIHNDIGTNYLRLNFNKWAIPFLIYYGKGYKDGDLGGGTWFNKNVALTLRGDKAKRIYKFICSQDDQDKYEYPIAQFRKDYEISPDRDNDYIKRMLQKAKERIDNSESKVKFNFKLFTKHPINNGRKPKADYIIFTIKNTAAKKGTDQDNRNETIIRWLGIALEYVGAEVDAAFDAIMQGDKTEDFYNRLCWWDDQIAKGNMTTDHVKNSIRKVLREDYNIKHEKWNPAKTDKQKLQEVTNKGKK